MATLVWLDRKYMNNFELYIFDFDGVIANSEPVFAELEYQFIKSIVPEWDKSLQDKLIGLNIHDSYNFIKHNTHFNLSETAFIKQYQEIYEKVFKHVKPVDGIARVLRYLHVANFIVVIASSTSKKYIADFLKKYNMFNYINEIFSTQDLKIKGKPTSDIYQYIIKNYNISAQKTVALEDSNNGIMSAKEAGVFCIGVNSSKDIKNLEKADIIIETPLRLDTVIKNYQTVYESKKYLKILKNTPNAIVIYSPTSLEQVKYQIPKTLNWINANVVKNNPSDVIKKIKNTNGSDTIIGMGGGTALDLAKYISFKTNRHCICIPTMMSTNVFSTNKSSVNITGIKQTVDSKIPDKIIFDPKLLSKSSQLNLFGIADIFSIHTALYDWKNSNEKIDEWVAHRSNQLLERTIDLLKNNSVDRLLDNPKLLYELIGEAGQITNIYGSGRPESGSEHIFAAELEKKVKIPHGVSVSLGILLMMYLQDNISEDVVSSILKLNTLKNLSRFRIVEDDVIQILLDLVPRKDRHSAVDVYSRDKTYLQKTVHEVFSIIESSYVNN
jgi:HAD superfamily hydrolase (TIGR01509 family)